MSSFPPLVSNPYPGARAAFAPEPSLSAAIGDGLPSLGDLFGQLLPRAPNALNALPFTATVADYANAIAAALGATR